jgi:hypothetical protein
MNIQEKQAWSNLCVFGGSLVLYLIVALTTHFSPLLVAMFGVCVAGGVASLIGIKERKKAKLIMDERDIEIARCAGAGTIVIFVVLFAIGMMFFLFSLGPSASFTVKIDTLGNLFFLVFLIVTSVHALVTIVLYRRDHHE